jgi:integrase
MPCFLPAVEMKPRTLWGCQQLAGLKRPGISNYALRHTAATLGYLHTGNLRAVQELLGHADPRMIARYAHVVDMAKKNPALFIPVKVR